MAKVEIFKKIPGIPSSGPEGAYEDPLNYVFSHSRESQNEVLAQVMSRVPVAKAKLAAHRDTGASKIEVSGGAVDYYVTLTDEASGPRDDNSVLSIEFGGRNGRGGVSPLRTAFPELR